MAKDLPQLEQSELTKYIEPKGEYQKFDDLEEFLKVTRKYGLNSTTSKKTEFWYKEKFYKRKVTIDGYEKHGEYHTLVIKFLDDNLMCISPYYLKEMQSSSFGEESSEEEIEEKVKQQKQQTKKEKPKEEKENEEKVEEKVVLPEEKMKVTAIVSGFGEVYNTFAERNDVVVIYEQLELNDGEYKLEKAWSSMSKTLEKMGIKEGDRIECEAKFVSKKLKTHDLYKMNNPSKIKLN